MADAYNAGLLTNTSISPFSSSITEQVSEDGPQCNLTAPPITTPPESAKPFTSLQLSPFQRLHISQEIDSVITALCILLVTATTGSMLARLARMQRQKGERTLDSLIREETYSSAFQPGFRSFSGRSFWRTDLSKKHLSWAFAALMLLAAIVWLVLETTLIFLALPRTVGLRMPHRLEHVVVASPEGVVNFGPISILEDKCRTVEWSADTDDISTRLQIRRCGARFQRSALAATELTARDIAASDTSTFTVSYEPEGFQVFLLLSLVGLAVMCFG